MGRFHGLSSAFVVTDPPGTAAMVPLLCVVQGGTGLFQSSLLGRPGNLSAGALRRSRYGSQRGRGVQWLLPGLGYKGQWGRVRLFVHLRSPGSQECCALLLMWRRQ